MKPTSIHGDTTRRTRSGSRYSQGLADWQGGELGRRRNHRARAASANRSSQTHQIGAGRQQHAAVRWQAAREQPSDALGPAFQGRTAVTARGEGAHGRAWLGRLAGRAGRCKRNETEAARSPTSAVLRRLGEAHRRAHLGHRYRYDLRLLLPRGRAGGLFHLALCTSALVRQPRCKLAARAVGARLRAVSVAPAPRQRYAGHTTDA